MAQNVPAGTLLRFCNPANYPPRPRLRLLSHSDDETLLRRALELATPDRGCRTETTTGAEAPERPTLNAALTGPLFHGCFPADASTASFTNDNGNV